MPRLFTGIEIPADVALELDLMRGGIEGARWIDRDSYHITLRFIGDIPEGLAREIAHALDRVVAMPFTLRLKGIGLFGGNRPNSLHALVEESPGMRRLQATHERLCQSLGLPPDPRRFVPHVTLARLKANDPTQALRYASAHNLFRSRPFEVSRFVLFSSRPSRGGGPYAVEEAYELSAAI